MGHHTETTEIPLSATIQTPSDALQAACDEARYNNGAYMGINTGPLRVLNPMTKNEYGDDDDLTHLGRYSVITPIIDDSTIARRTVNKALTFTGYQWEKAKAAGTLHEAIVEAATKEVTLRAGERVEIVSPNENGNTSRLFRAALTNGKHISFSSKVLTRNTEGKAVTRYAVLANGNRHSGHRELWENGHGSQAAARKHMISLMDQHAGSNYMDEAEIVAVTRRENGDPLVVSKREISKVKVNVAMTIAKIPAKPKFSHYRVSFDVHT